MNTRIRLLALSSLATLAIAACGQKDQPAGGESATAQPSAEAGAAGGAATAGSPQTPDAGREVITVTMETDDQGNNKFTPADFEAKKGDVIRFTLKNGVHNVHFLADSNPGRTGLPAASDMLQLAGQTYDVKVTWNPGVYYYQCDPHALLGMKGHVKVE